MLCAMLSPADFTRDAANVLRRNAASVGYLLDELPVTKSANADMGAQILILQTRREINVNKTGLRLSDHGSAYGQEKCPCLAASMSGVSNGKGTMLNSFAAEV